MSKVNLPNIISFFRLIVSPIFFYFFTSSDNLYQTIGSLLYLIAALTDMLDGWAARRFLVVTRWGEFLDPLADKVLTIFALISFTQIGILPPWMLVVIIIRDILATGLRIYAISKGNPIKTSKSAKVKTTIQMIFIGIVIFLIFLKNNIEIDNPGQIVSILKSNVFYFCFLLITLMALYSVVGYLWRYRSLILKQKN